MAVSSLHPRSRGARGSRAAAFALAAASLTGAPAQAASLPSGFTERLVASGLDRPTAMAFAPDGRLFVCLQGGQLRVVKNGQLLGTPFLTVSVNSSGERGLLGVAFDPDFAANRFVYVYYTTASSPVHNRVSRFVANGDVAQSGSETQILNLNNLSGATNHNGGAMHFGPDGRLYVAVGENANGSNAQTLGNLLGKMLRINKDGTIPSDNPFFNQATGNNRAIWALGLRNPFNFAFERGTGRMYINDVGQNTWEEINQGVRGANYGWPETEGPTNDPDFRGPIYAYQHSGGACSIIGAAFYNPVTRLFPAEYVGSYFFGDFCAGFMRRRDSGGTIRNFSTGHSSLVDVKVSDDGTLWYLERGGGGRLFQVSPSGQGPQISIQPADRTVTVGQTAAFSVSATGTAPLRYQWRRNGGNVPGATASSHTTAPTTLDDDGSRFAVVVSNDFGSVTSRQALLTVTENDPPTGTITAPGHRTLYSAGDTVAFSGVGSDAEDGTLPASAFTWQVDFHHADHTHPFVPPTSGVRSGSFTIPRVGHTETNVFYRVHLTVRDAGGLTHASFVDLLPRIVTLDLATAPTGLRLTLDGQPMTAPLQTQSVVGVERVLGAVSPQASGGTTWVFDSWSDGGAATHTVTTPSVGTTYTATFREGSADCFTVPGGAGFLNRPFGSRTGTFTAEFEATPSARPVNSTLGLSRGSATVHNGMAAIVRFNPSGNLDARNGGTYAAAATIPYAAGTAYRFRMVVNVTTRRYSVFVTPAGGTERTLASNFAFRSQQAGVTSLDTLTAWTSSSPAGQVGVCGFTASEPPPPTDCVTARPGAGYQNRPFASQAGAFTAEFDATPSANRIDVTMALSRGARTAHTGFATLVRFNSAGNIDARNGGTYAAAAAIPYTAGQTYRFRLVVNVATRRYSAFVTPPGGAERTVASNFAFRSEQSGVTSLDHVGVRFNSSTGEVTVCGFRVTGAATLALRR